MIRKAILLFSLFLACTPFLVAGDIARFMNLGFSDDSRYFMFGQYGINEETSTPYADCYIVDVAKNDFVSQGTFSEKYSIKVEPGNDGIGGMLSLIAKNLSSLKNYRINHLLTGRIVYVLIDGQKPISSLEFRDFSTGVLYAVKLSQTQKVTGGTLSSGFSIEVVATSTAGKKTTSRVGRPEFLRKGVREYRIKYLLLAPDGKSLVFVLEKSVVTGDGEDIRYMVETKRIDGN